MRRASNVYLDKQEFIDAMIVPLRRRRRPEEGPRWPPTEQDVRPDGSNKAWEVRGDEPATFGTVMCASVAVGVTPPGDQRAGQPLPAGVVLPVDAGLPATTG